MISCVFPSLFYDIINYTYTKCFKGYSLYQGSEILEFFKKSYIYY